MQEIRVHFAPSDENSHRVSLTDGNSNSVEVSFSPFRSDDDYDNMRWYLDEYMELCDGGAVVRAEHIEADLLKWGQQLHDAIFFAPENKAALETLFKAASLSARSGRSAAARTTHRRAAGLTPSVSKRGRCVNTRRADAQPLAKTV